MAPDAGLCAACESGRPGPLVELIRLDMEDEDTTPSVHIDVPELQRWATSTQGTAEEGGPSLDLTLRPLDDLSRVTETAPPPGPSAIDWITADPPTAGATVADAAGEPLAAPPASSKVMHRAQVRRRQMEARQAETAACTVVTDVLVLESDDQASMPLCSLLEGFGFRAHPVQSTEQAVQMLAAKRFVAAFLNLAFDGPLAAASSDLCQRVNAPPPHATDPVCALIIMSASVRPVERVRATLAGSGAFLSQPVNRGSVAQALEACGVALPADARRG